MNLKNHFLIAMPSLNEDLFSRSVIYICEHNNNGAMGIIINKPIEDLYIGAMLNRLDIPSENIWDSSILKQPVFYGGPLAKEHGFIIHPSIEGFSSSIQVTNDIMVTTSQDILTAMSKTNQPTQLLIALGYAEWGENQLETEIINNDWLVTAADNDIIFNTPIDTKWNMAAQLLGINIATISTHHSSIQ